MPIDPTKSRAGLIEAARGFRPHASASDVTMLGEGQLTIALSIDDYVLRFPRSDFARDELRREVSILDAIRPYISVPLPEIVADELGRDIGQAFVAHRLLPGKMLTFDRAASLSPQARARIADQVATFLRELHAVPPSSVPMAPDRPLDDFARSLREEVSTLLWSRLSAAGRKRAERELATLAAVPCELNVPCASDIGGNIVYDATSGSVAFIDFGDTIVSDPVLDVASLSVLGEDFAVACGVRYSVVAERLERSRAVRETFALQDALYGARQRDWAYVDAALSQYDPANT